MKSTSSAWSLRASHLCREQALYRATNSVREGKPVGISGPGSKTPSYCIPGLMSLLRYIMRDETFMWDARCVDEGHIRERSLCFRHALVLPSQKRPHSESFGTVRSCLLCVYLPELPRREKPLCSRQCQQQSLADCVKCVSIHRYYM